MRRGHPRTETFRPTPILDAVGFGIGRVDLEGAAILRLGTGQVLATLEDRAQLVVVFGVVGLDLIAAAELRLGTG